MCSNIIRRKMRGRCSIVDQVNCRSIIGQWNGLEAHLHSEWRIALLWNIHIITGCFSSCIVRFAADCVVVEQLAASLDRSRALGERVFYCKYIRSVDGGIKEDCIYMGYRALENRQWSYTLWRHWDYPEFKCQCKEISFSGTFSQVYMTVCCSKNGNFHCSKRILAKLSDCSTDDISLWMSSTDLVEV